MPVPAERQRVRLDFDPAVRDDPLHRDLSAVVLVGDDLWLASDEGCAVERLSRRTDGSFGDHASFRLGDFLDLPEGGDGEADVEGLAYADGYLWIVGSHSVRRKAPRADDPPKRRRRRLAAVEASGQRHLLARIPLVRPEGGGPAELRADAPGPSGAGSSLTAARLRGGRRRGALVRALKDDRHLAPFLDLPGKDNGLDVEGLVVVGDRAFVGLRGPVLRGWAVVLEVQLEPGDRPDRLELRAIGRKGRRYRRHFLDLAGLGVRELCRDGDDLLVLAGPTMVLDGRCHVLRWRDALGAEDGSMVERDALAPVVELSYGAGADEGVEHPEGMTLASTSDGRKALLVVYDAPHRDRCPSGASVEADLLPIG